MLVAWRSHHLVTLGAKSSQEVAGREAPHPDTCIEHRLEQGALAKAAAP